MHARGNLGYCQGMDGHIDASDRMSMLSLSALALTRNTGSLVA